MTDNALYKKQGKLAESEDIAGQPLQHLSRPHHIAPEDLRRTRFLENLYRAHSHDVCGWLRRRFGSGPPAPEDIVQTAFERLAKLDCVEHIQHPKSFLYRTAANAALDAIGRNRRFESLLNDELTRRGDRLEEMTPEYVSLSKERFACMSQTLTGLSPKQREAIIRNRFRGETYEQIAFETGWSKSDIFRQVQSALIVIRNALDNYDAACGGEGHEHGR